MRILLIRHADTASGAAYPEDAMRPLTESGVRIQKKVAQRLEEDNIRPEILLHSPRLRAEQTAGILAYHYPEPVPMSMLPVLDGGHSLESLCRALAAYGAYATVACVGHEPDMSLWYSGLLQGENGVTGFGKSDVAMIEFGEGRVRPHAGRSVYYLRAREFASAP